MDTLRVMEQDEIDEFSPRGSTDAVNIIFRGMGIIVINDITNIVYVETSRSNICSHEGLAISTTEAL